VFEVSFAFDQPVDVRIGSYLVEDLLITYETGVYGGVDSDDKLKVSYRVERRFELTYETTERDGNRFLVEYVHQF
jgi:autotransporter translocation and assembly factor TamB